MKIRGDRIEKIRSLLLKEVALYVKFELGIMDFQITRVLLSHDFKRVKIFFVKICEDKRPELESFLNKKSKKIRNDLFKKLGLKYLPEFIFEYDREVIGDEFI